MTEVVSDNWKPDNYVEFQHACWRGAVTLNMTPNHYSWARGEVLTRAILPKSNDKIRAAVLQRMSVDNEFFELAYKRKGIDLMLLEESSS
ncbi:MAG: hypothetical protein AAFV59_04505 [Pseudomonadota bacterium]